MSEKITPTTFIDAFVDFAFKGLLAMYASLTKEEQGYGSYQKAIQ